MRLVGIAMAKRQRGPLGTRRAVGGAQERMEALNTSKVPGREPRLQWHGEIGAYVRIEWIVVDVLRRRDAEERPAPLELDADGLHAVAGWRCEGMRPAHGTDDPESSVAGQAVGRAQAHEADAH